MPRPRPSRWRGGCESAARLQPVFIRRFNAAAQPLDHLEYLLEAPEKALLIDGGAALVNVPAPARFAFHKLLVATLRPAAFQAKAAKDVAQACEVLEMLVAERPGDLQLAWDDLRTRGSRWEKAAKRGLVLANLLRPEVHERVRAVLETNGSSRRKGRADR